MQAPSFLRGSAPGIVAALLLTAALSALLRWHATAEGHGARVEAMPVAVATYHEQPAYQRQRRFFGLVEAAQRADLGFETSGQLATMAVDEGSSVEAGDLLATLDDQRLQAQRAAAAAELATLQADLELARLKAKRQEDLQATGAVSREAFDETRLRAKALGAQQDAVAAQLRRLDIELEKLQLKAPFAGVIAARYLDPGTIVAAGSPVLRLIQSGDREAHVGVTPELAATLQPGQSYTLQWREQSLSAQLRSVRPDVDPATRATIAVFTLSAGTGILDGETVSLNLSDRVESRGGWLPLSALLEGQRGIWNVLLLQREGERYQTRRGVVEVLAIQGDRAYVRGTLRDGQQVVGDGLHRIAAGAVVTPLES